MHEIRDDRFLEMDHAQKMIKDKQFRPLHQDLYSVGKVLKRDPWCLVAPEVHYANIEKPD